MHDIFFSSSDYFTHANDTQIKSLTGIGGLSYIWTVLPTYCLSAFMLLTLCLSLFCPLRICSSFFHQIFLFVVCSLQLLCPTIFFISVFCPTINIFPCTSVHISFYYFTCLSVFLLCAIMVNTYLAYIYAMLAFSKCFK